MGVCPPDMAGSGCWGLGVREKWITDDSDLNGLRRLGVLYIIYNNITVICKRKFKNLRSGG